MHMCASLYCLLSNLTSLLMVFNMSVCLPEEILWNLEEALLAS